MRINYLTSAICPIKNEQDNIRFIYNTLPELNGKTEVIFVEGESKDKSWEIIRKIHGTNNAHGVYFRGVKQKGSGKGEAVATGVTEAKGENLIILDADLSVRPKDLCKILHLLSREKDIVASGNRLQGIKKPKAFYWINYIGNYFFRYYYSIVMKSNILDISCGSKAMNRTTWHKILALRKKEGSLDKWGDIDWLYYGKRINANFKYISIDYKNRKYGASKLQDMKTRFLFALDMFIIGMRIILKNLIST